METKLRGMVINGRAVVIRIVVIINNLHNILITRDLLFVLFVNRNPGVCFARGFFQGRHGRIEEFIIGCNVC